MGAGDREIFVAALRQDDRGLETMRGQEGAACCAPTGGQERGGVQRADPFTQAGSLCYLGGRRRRMPNRASNSVHTGWKAVLLNQQAKERAWGSSGTGDAAGRGKGADLAEEALQRDFSVVGRGGLPQNDIERVHPAGTPTR